MPFDMTPTNSMTLELMRHAITLQLKGATPKAIRSWLIGRTTYLERNHIMDAIVYS